MSCKFVFGVLRRRTHAVEQWRSSPLLAWICDSIYRRQWCNLKLRMQNEKKWIFLKLNSRDSNHHHSCWWNKFNCNRKSSSVVGIASFLIFNISRVRTGAVQGIASLLVYPTFFKQFSDWKLTLEKVTQQQKRTKFSTEHNEPTWVERRGMGIDDIVCATPWVESSNNFGFTFSVIYTLTQSSSADKRRVQLIFYVYFH